MLTIRTNCNSLVSRKKTALELFQAERGEFNIRATKGRSSSQTQDWNWIGEAFKTPGSSCSPSFGSVRLCTANFCAHQHSLQWRTGSLQTLSFRDSKAQILQETRRFSLRGSQVYGPVRNNPIGSRSHVSALVQSAAASVEGGSRSDHVASPERERNSQRWNTRCGQHGVNIFLL